MEAFHLLQEGLTVCPPEWTFYVTYFTFSAVEAREVTHISISKH